VPNTVASSSREFLFRVADRLSGQGLFDQLLMLRKEQDLSPVEVARRQEERLSRLLHYARKNSLFYSERIPPDAENQGVAGLPAVPILRKSELIAHSEHIATGSIKGLVAMRSGGSSGQSSTVWVTRRNLGLLRATQLLWWEWAGYQIGTPAIQIGVTPRDPERKLKDLLLNIDYVFTSDLAARSCEILQDVRHGKRRHVMGYPSRIVDLARRAGEEAAPGGERPALTSIILFGDKIFEHDLALVERTFAAPVYESYGSAEGFLVAARKGQPRSLEVMGSHAIVEIVDFEGRPVPPGQLGRIVVTVLDNLTMPLIRYDTGDLGRLAPPSTADHRDRPCLDREICRQSELIGRDLEDPFTVHDLARLLHQTGPVENFRLKRLPDGVVHLQTFPEGSRLGTGLSEVAYFLEHRLNEPILVGPLEGVPRLPSGKPEFVSL
jgi:phenylacetate-CoA ligase